jgi:DHA3 family tetracycline resistance protein-like MFS transporter
VPWIAGGLGSVAMGVFLLFTMTEAGWRPSPSTRVSRVSSMRRIAVAGVSEARRRPAVRAALGTRFLFGASSEVFMNFWGYHLLVGIGLSGGVDEALLFGGIMLVGQVGGLALIAYGRRLSADGSRASAARVLSALYIAWVVAMLVLAIAPSAVIAIAVVGAARMAMGAEQPFFLMWANRGLDPSTRATVLSTLGQADSIGQVAQGPFAAAVVGLGSVRAAIAGGALLVLPVAALVRTRASDEPVTAIEDVSERA